MLRYEIKETTKFESYYVETYRGEFYTHHSADNWFVRVGESDEPFQESLKEK